MPRYIRPKLEGACWFFTVNLLTRDARLLTDNIAALREAVRKTLRRFPLHIDAIVILPDHLHAVWTLPEGDGDFSVRIGLIKARFSRTIPKTDHPCGSRRHRGERGIWQRRFWEHAIRDTEDYRRHVEYCYINPVKHGHVRRVRDWPYSSFHRDVRARLFPEDWAGEWEDDAEEFGERR